MEPWFIGRVRKTPEGCWVWTGTLHSDGYGVFTLRGETWLAHRYAWTVRHGILAPAAHVLHRCDNPPCVNPDHLFLGDQPTNNADMLAKGRQMRGERQHLAKLTDAAVVEIRARIAQGESGPAIAREYGVDRRTINRLARRETWTHI